MTAANAYWDAAQAYRAASTDKELHDARVALLAVALVDSPAGRRAAATLRKDGIAVIRCHDLAGWGR